MNKEFIINSLDKMIENPKCELDYTSDYTLLIAILLSAQCLDKQVNKITPILFSKYPTLNDLKTADVNDLKDIIKPLGLANNKSKAIKNLATILVEKHNSKEIMGNLLATIMKLVSFRPSYLRMSGTAKLEKIVNNEVVEVIESPAMWEQMAFRNDRIKY